LLAAFAVCAMASPAAAVTIDIFQHTGYLDWNENPGATTIAADADVVGNSVVDDTAFTGAGFGVSFAASLDADSLGTLTWTITNTGAAAVTGVRFLAFLNADILDPAFMDSFNEFAAFEAFGLPPGAPVGAIAFTSYEADDPFFGDILSNLDAGALDASIATDFDTCSATFDCDVALALGFLVGTLDPGEGVSATLLISAFEPGGAGLSQTDLDSAESILFNGYVVVREAEPPVAMTAPPALGLFMLGLLAISALRRDVMTKCRKILQVIRQRRAASPNVTSGDAKSRAFVG
jgi:hypothetical protein